MWAQKVGEKQTIIQLKDSAAAVQHPSTAAAPPHRKEPVEVLRASDKDASCWGGGMSHREEAWWDI